MTAANLSSLSFRRMSLQIGKLYKRCAMTKDHWRNVLQHLSKFAS